ncbi:hypothetical protein T484DRAFT_1807634 [Baffinella frigidus]|nr:hypothetical protein T484DRAFT_1807634 [Cryptophyta sp. CCMP2293]
MRELLFPLLLLAILPLAGSSEDPGEERGGEPSLGGAVCSGTGLSAAAVGRPSRFTIQLLRRDGSNVTGGGDGKRFTDRGDGRYEVELYHEWVTKTSPEHGLSNVTVLVEGKHACGSPFIFGTDHQFAVHRRKGSPRIEPPALEGPVVVGPVLVAHHGGSAGAYATLVATEEFALGAVVLAHSLRSVGARYPLVAMVTARIDDETEALLRHAGVPPMLSRPMLSRPMLLPSPSLLLSALPLALPPAQ